MTSSELGITIGVMTSALVTLGPWMFMVHAKLAVIAAQIVALTEKVDKAADTNQQLWSRYAQHETRLGTHDVQLSHITERIQEL